ncbi:MAG: EutN/CcmL family microcompartment protein [Candidatus Eisenbacteria bacterium]|nr:EutN/CcmL family microcompartment protein [Candidatus Eisenbacteria bacterium]
MLIGQVIGRVVATIRAPGLAGVRFLLVQPLDERCVPLGTPIVAADATRTAGPGDLVHYEGGREAAMALDPSFVPVDHAIVGLIDQLAVEPPVPGVAPS